MRRDFFVLLTLISIAASCVIPSNSYNPSPVPPSSGRFPVGYDPLSRGRPFEEPRTPQNSPRRGVLKAKRWEPPEGYRPRRTDRMPLRTAEKKNAVRTVEDNNVEYIKWDNPPNSQHSTLCTGIWCNNRILYKTCVRINTTATDDLNI